MAPLVYINSTNWKDYPSLRSLFLLEYQNIRVKQHNIGEGKYMLIFAAKLSYLYISVFCLGRRHWIGIIIKIPLFKKDRIKVQRLYGPNK